MAAAKRFLLVFVLSIWFLADRHVEASEPQYLPTLEDLSQFEGDYQPMKAMAIVYEPVEDSHSWLDATQIWRFKAIPLNQQTAGYYVYKLDLAGNPIDGTGWVLAAGAKVHEYLRPDPHRILSQVSFERGPESIVIRIQRFAPITLLGLQVWKRKLSETLYTLAKGNLGLIVSNSVTRGRVFRRLPRVADHVEYSMPFRFQCQNYFANFN